MANRGRTTKASRKPGLKASCDPEEQLSCVRGTSGRRAPNYFFKSVTAYSTSPVGFPFTLMELFVFTDHLS